MHLYLTNVFMKQIFSLVMLLSIIFAFINNIVLIFLGLNLTFFLFFSLFCELKFKSLIKNFYLKLITKSFIVCFDEMYNSNFFTFYKLFGNRNISSYYLVKNKNFFLRFCKLKTIENDFLCYGVIVEPLFDFVLTQQLFSFCGTIQLTTKTKNSLIYNLMQFTLPSLNIIFSLLRKDKNCLYFWLVSSSNLLLKTFYNKKYIDINIQFKEQNSIELTKTFIKFNMSSITKNLPINSFFFGFYQNYSFLRLFKKTILDDYFFIAEISKVQYTFNLHSDFYNFLFENNLFGDEWLFFAPQIAIKEHSIIETISTVE